MASVEIMSGDFGRFGVEWDVDRHVLRLSDRVRDVVVRFHGDFRLRPEQLVEWMLENDAAIAHALGVDWLEFRDHLQRIF